MSEKFLHRSEAPFSDKVWQAIDEAVVEAAKTQLTARRLLSIEGPYGLGLKAIPGPDVPVDEKGAAGAVVSASSMIPVALLQSSFTLAARDIAAFEGTGLPLPLKSAADAAIACARQEDALVLYGSGRLGVEGLLTAKGTKSLKLKAWKEVGAAVEDLIQAVTKLDEAGFHGPYALALEPSRYNLLFRRYPQGNQTEIEHVRTLVAGGVVKAPGIASGGVLLATGRQFATIVLGQDLMTRFVGPAGEGYEFLTMESLALRLLEPSSVCVFQ